MNRKKIRGLIATCLGVLKYKMEKMGIQKKKEKRIGLLKRNLLPSHVFCFKRPSSAAAGLGRVLSPSGDTDGVKTRSRDFVLHSGQATLKKGYGRFEFCLRWRGKPGGWNISIGGKWADSDLGGTAD